MKKFIKRVLRKIRKMLPKDKVAEKCKKYHITKEEYKKQRYDLLTDSELKRLMTKPIIAAKVDYGADRLGLPRGEVFAKAIEVMKAYKGITLGRFVKEDLFYNHSEEEMTAILKRQEEAKDEQFDLLADIMGISTDEAKTYVAEMREEFGVGIAEIMEEQLFKLNKEEIEQLLKDKKEENERRKEIIKQENNWDDFQLARHRHFCSYRYQITTMKSYFNLKCYKYPAEVLDTFSVPTDCFDLGDTYNTASTDVLDNKILFDKTYSEFLYRKFWVNKDTTLDEFKEFIEGQTRVFCKPINLLSGHGCYVYDLTGDAEKDYEYFINEPKLLVEEIPVQHHLVNEIYDKSVNTVRLATVLKDGKCVPIFSWMKFGAKGSIVDGRIGGGCYAGVNIETGTIETPAIDYDNNRFDFHPDTGKPIRGFKIPYYKEALELVDRALRHVEGIGFVGWDICITENGPIIIEGNAHPAFVELQLLYLYEGHEGDGQRWRYIDLLEDPDKRRRVRK